MFKCKLKELPTSLNGAYYFLNPYVKTTVGLDESGKSEGLIGRSFDRKYIVKLRFEDYEKTFRIAEMQNNK